MRLKIKEALASFNKKNKANKTMSELAEEVFKGYNITPNMKSRYLSDMNNGNRRSAKPEEIVLISKILKTDPNFLLGF